jgi:LPXTG-site transpeptidase (sortase) family protein
VSLRVDTTDETPSEPVTAGEDAVTEEAPKARLSARWRAAVLVCLVGAVAAIGAGVYVLVASDSARTGSLASPATLTDPAQTPATPVVVPKVTYALPVRLVIPKIGLNAAVERVGLTSKRAMASPSGPGTVGWYKFGPRPGNEGSAVIDGHSGYADGRRAAFDDLPQLKVGDKFYVKDARGKRLVFVVRKKKLFARNASSAEVFAPSTGRRLNLITCTGAFDVAAGTHSQRLVVFAVLRSAQGSAGQQ